MALKTGQEDESTHALDPGWPTFLGLAFDGEEAMLLQDVVAPANRDTATVALDILLSGHPQDAAWTRMSCLGQRQQQSVGMPDEALLRACIQRLARECPPDASIIGPPPAGPSVALEPVAPGSPARVPPWLWPAVCWILGVCGAVISLILMQILYTHRAERRSDSVFP